jgi:hypothetical protein
LHPRAQENFGAITVQLGAIASPSQAVSEARRCMEKRWRSQSADSILTELNSERGRAAFPIPSRDLRHRKLFVRKFMIATLECCGARMFECGRNFLLAFLKQDQSRDNGST